MAENLKMMPALLSRFDLVFILIDTPDEAHDRLMSEHIFSLHKAQGVKRTRLSQPPPAHGESKRSHHNHHNSACTGKSFGSSLNKMDELEQSADDDLTPEGLERRIQDKGDEFQPIPPVLLRKYIGYARKYVRPKLTAGAKALLLRFYLELRSSHRSDDTTPVTTRQLESLIRLTEARAKAELRLDARTSDARDAIAIMQGAIRNGHVYGLDPVAAAGCVDYRQASQSSGVRASRARLATHFVSVLNAEAARRGSGLFTFIELADTARTCGLAGVVGDFADFIERLNLSGYLLRSGRAYRLATFSS